MAEIPSVHTSHDRFSHPNTIHLCRVMACEFLQTAFTNVVKARRSKEGNEKLAAYHALAADNIEEALLWVKDIAQ